MKNLALATVALLALLCGVAVGLIAAAPAPRSRAVVVPAPVPDRPCRGRRCPNHLQAHRLAPTCLETPLESQ